MDAPRGREAAALGLVVLAAALGLWLLVARPAAVAPAPVRPRTFASPEEAALWALVVERTGEAERPRPFGGPGLPFPGGADGAPRLAMGREVWRTQCMHCHGFDGRADTPTADLLEPRPRDFSLGVVKYTSTEAGAPATRDDLERTVRNGLDSTAMSAFRGLPEASLRTVVDYTAWLLVRGDLWTRARAALAEDLTPEAALDRVWESTLEDWRTAPERVVAVPPAPRDAATLVEEGRRLWTDPRAGCADCHGADGRGRGPQAWDAAAERWLLRDAWGREARPRDLTTGNLLGGRTTPDLYRRIHAGVKGTPMTGRGELLEPREIHALVAWVRRLAER